MITHTCNKKWSLEKAAAETSQTNKLVSYCDIAFLQYIYIYIYISIYYIYIYIYTQKDHKILVLNKLK